MAPLHATLRVNIRHAVTHSICYVCQFIIGNKMSPQIISTIEEGKRLKLKTEEMVIKYDYPQDEKNLILLGYHSILVEHHDSIHLLISKKLYGSAFALVRALHETLYRALWVNACATDKQIEKIIGGKDIFPMMKEMLENIDSAYATGDFWQTIKRNSWTAMNDYTHSGIRQISRRFVNDAVSSNYEIGEIVEVLDATNVALLLMALFHFKIYKKSNEIKKIEKMILSYKNA